MTADQTNPETAQEAELDDTIADDQDLTSTIAEPAEDVAETEENVAEGDVTDNLRQEIEMLRQQVEENFDKALRAQAEMDNLRKRTGRDMENAHKYALEKFIKELLPVIDSMELGISASYENVEDIDSLREGMDLTLKKFIDTLQKFGVEVVHPEDEKFNPEKHQAVTMQEVEGVEPGTVTAVMQKGYELNGRLVRPAMVIVAR
jgi:molecular chaperone GrpE